MLAPEAEPLIKQLLHGISIDLRVNVWKQVADILIKVVE